MVSDQKERDFNDQSALKRPGRLDFRTLNNVDNAGDGHPGVQKCFRNYLHEGYMEKDLHLNSKNITNVGDVDGVDVSEVSLSNQPTAATGNIDCGTQAITNVGNVDGIDISAIAFDNMPTAPSGDIPVNSQQITGLADGVDVQDAMAFGQKYTDGEVQALSINNVVEDTTPQLGGDLDCLNKHIDNINHLILDEVAVPSNIANHGILFVDDNNVLKYMDELGVARTVRLTSEYGFFGGGNDGTWSDIMEYIDTNVIVTINSIDRGNLTVARYELAAVTGPVWGFFCGGANPADDSTTDFIDMSVIVTINAVDRGYSTHAQSDMGAVSGSVYGHFGGGGSV